MDELAEGLLSVVARFLITTLKVVRFIAWDLLFEVIGWAIGWSFLRLVTFGRFPKQGWRGVDDAHGLLAFTVELLGISIICLTIMLLSRFI